MPAFRSVLPLALVALWGCGSDTAVSSSAVVDSAGATIVTHSPNAMESLEVWRADSVPLFSVGDLDGALAFARIVDVQPLESGRLAVLDGQSRLLHFLQRGGGWIRSVGGPGEGPGEFSVPVRVLPLGGDTVAVWDFRSRRLTEFDGEGVFVHAVAVDLPHGPGDGPMLHRVGDGYAVQGMGSLSDVEESRGRPMNESLRLGRNGAVVGRYGSFPGAEFFRSEKLMGIALLGAVPVAAGRGDDFVVGAAEAPEIRVFGATGALEATIRWPDWDRTVTAEMIERTIEGQVRSVPVDQRDGLEEMLRREMPAADHYPPYNTLLVDDGGRVWVGRHRRPWEKFTPTTTPETEWTVFDRDGVARARLVTPAGLRVHAVADQRLIGVSTDDLDIQRVVAYAYGPA